MHRFTPNRSVSLLVRSIIPFLRIILPNHVQAHFRENDQWNLFSRILIGQPIRIIFLRVENWRERKRGKLKKEKKLIFKNDDFSWISTSINHWSFGSTNQHPACGKPIDRHFMCTWHVTNMSLTVTNLYLGVCVSCLVVFLMGFQGFFYGFQEIF